MNKFKLLFVICVIVLICFVAVGGVDVSGSVKNVDKQYRSVLISEGDTIWDIADEYNDKDLSYMSNKNYIKEIERINNINIDHITAGNYIIVPIFVLAE